MRENDLPSSSAQAATAQPSKSGNSTTYFTLSGPSLIDEGEYGHWTITPSDDGDCSYLWYQRYTVDGDTVLAQTGGKSYSFRIDGISSSRFMLLELHANGNKVASKPFTVNNNDGPGDDPPGYQNGVQGQSEEGTNKICP